MTKWLLAGLVIWLVWRLLSKRPARPDRAITDEAEACRVLGVAPDADADVIRTAHRRLVSETHPDRGGSVEDTRRVNAARDLLLDRRS